MLLARSKHEPRGLAAARVVQTAALIALLGLATTACGKSKPASNPSVTPTASIPRTNLRPITGTPAIKPSSAAGVTVDQVRTYAASHPVVHALSRDNPTVTNVIEMSAGALSTALNGENFAVPSDEKLIVAELSGGFVFPGPPGVENTYKLAVEVFDASTGNFLASGGLLTPIPKSG